MSGGIPKEGSRAFAERGGGPAGRGGWTGAGGAAEEDAKGSRGLVHVTSPVLAFQKYHAFPWFQLDGFKVD